MVDKNIIHHDTSLFLHITISANQDIIIFMMIMQGVILNMLIMRIDKSPLFEKAIGAISFSSIQALLQTKHMKEHLFNTLDATMGENCKHLLQSMFKVVVSWLSTNIGKEQLFFKFVTSQQASFLSLQATHVKEQLCNILHAMGEKVKHS
jgi:hypothetical protein